MFIIQRNKIFTHAKQLQMQCWTTSSAWQWAEVSRVRVAEAPWPLCVSSADLHTAYPDLMQFTALLHIKNNNQAIRIAKNSTWNASEICAFNFSYK